MAENMTKSPGLKKITEHDVNNKNQNLKSFVVFQILVAQKRLTTRSEAGLIGCISLVRHILPFLKDSTLMDNLQVRFLCCSITYVSYAVYRVNLALNNYICELTLGESNIVILQNISDD